MAAVQPTGVESIYSGLLAPLPSLYIMQTKRGCIQELMGCDAKSEFLIATKEDQKAVQFYGLEESSFMMRLCCKNQRPLTMNIHKGENGEGPKMLKFDRPYRCMPAACKPCCQQEINVSDAATGSVVGSAKEGSCYICPTPYYQIKDGSGTTQFELQQPVCCGGLMVNIFAEGLCNCKIPFYLYPPGKRAEADIKGKVIKEWGGLVAEMFTSADKFSVEFPTDATPETKAAIWAGVMLVDYNHFEGGTDQSDSGGMGVMGGMLGAAPAPETEMMDR